MAVQHSSSRVLPWVERARRSTGEKLSLSQALSESVGLHKIRVELEVLPPGRKSSTPHHHQEQEELCYVLEGRVCARVGDDVVELEPGDVVGFPAGSGEDHFLFNSSEREARFLSVAGPLEAAPLKTPV